jgi:hypothetical protein
VTRDSCSGASLARSWSSICWDPSTAAMPVRKQAAELSGIPTGSATENEHRLVAGHAQSGYR